MTYNDLNFSKMDIGDFSLDELCAAGGEEPSKEMRYSSEAMNIPQMKQDIIMDDLDFDTKFYEQFIDDEELTSGTLNQWSFPFKMEDVYQVDKFDPNLSPTLAKLNSPNDPPPDCLSTFDYLLPFEDSFPSTTKALPGSASSNQPELSELNNPKSSSNLEQAISNMDWAFEITTPNKQELKQSLLLPTLSSSCPVSSPSLWRSVIPKKEIFTENLPSFSPAIDSENQKPPPHILRPIKVKEEEPTFLSTSAPVNTSQLHNRPFLRHRNNSNTDRSLGSFSSLSLSNDEGFDSHCEDSNAEDDLSSDGETYLEEIEEKVAMGHLADYSNSGTKKKKRYFWQYNTQSKGPKGSRIPLTSEVSDPNLFHDITDPVFSSECHVAGVKHSGKARRGDGNDLTPNPRKLFTIGLELRKLNKVINDLSPATELDLEVRPVTRKEKNKLASRACRLKKKAQHEANKLKLYGLQEEHKRLLTTLSKMKPLMTQLVSNTLPDVQPVQKLITHLEEGNNVAGHTTEFVNQVLEQVAKGDSSGGLYTEKE